MATAAISGKDGVVSVTGSPGSVGDEVSQWEATLVTALLDATSFDSGGFMEFVEGLASCTGTLTAKGVAPVRGAVTDLTLQVKSGVGQVVISGAAILHQVTAGTPHDGLVEYTASFNYTGTFTIGISV